MRSPFLNRTTTCAATTSPSSTTFRFLSRSRVLRCCDQLCVLSFPSFSEQRTNMILGRALGHPLIILNPLNKNADPMPKRSLRSSPWHGIKREPQALMRPFPSKTTHRGPATQRRLAAVSGSVAAVSGSWLLLHCRHCSQPYAPESSSSFVPAAWSAPNLCQGKFPLRDPDTHSVQRGPPPPSCRCISNLALPPPSLSLPGIPAYLRISEKKGRHKSWQEWLDS